jgi:hypothetical protein
MGISAPKPSVEMPTLPSCTKNEKQLPWVEIEIGFFPNFYFACSAAQYFMHSFVATHMLSVISI